MTTIELKLSLIRKLNQIEDETILQHIQDYVNHLTQKRQTKRYAAQMTVEELKNSITQSLQESQLGLGYSTEELRKRHPL